MDENPSTRVRRRVADEEECMFEPHLARAVTRVTETSCCGLEWASEGGQYLVLRTTDGVCEETARGRYTDARAVWQDILRGHRCDTRRPAELPAHA